MGLAMGIGGPAFDAGAAQLVFELKVTNGRVLQDMRIIRVKQGDYVKLRWSVDRPMTLHFHGYNIEKQVVPGTVGDMAFAARATGRFPVHAHTTGAQAGGEGEEVALVYIEVYPQ